MYIRAYYSAYSYIYVYIKTIAPEGTGRPGRYRIGTVDSYVIRKIYPTYMSGLGLYIYVAFEGFVLYAGGDYIYALYPNIMLLVQVMAYMMSSR